jgi:HEPN domain-containing protein
MPRNGENAGSPSDWIERAKSNLTRARQPKPEGVVYEDLCFDAQQAAEKALKALLIARETPFRFVHDIGELLRTLENSGVAIPATIRDAAELTEFAVEARYPGPFEPVTEDEWKRAVALAETVAAWVEKQLPT